MQLIALSDSPKQTEADAESNRHGCMWVLSKGERAAGQETGIEIPLSRGMKSVRGFHIGLIRLGGLRCRFHCSRSQVL